MKLFFKAIIFLSLCSPSSTLTNQPIIKNVVFDLNNVLLVNNPLGYFWNIGPTYFLRYMASLVYNKKSPSPKTIKKRMYETLRAVRTRTKNSPLAISPDKKLIPEIMYHWQINKISSKQAKEIVHNFIKNNPKFFISNAEQQLMLKLTEALFSPIIHSKMKIALTDGIKFVQECKKNGYNIYVLSNYDKDNFEVAYKTHQNLFKYISKENIVISGTSGKIKPNEDMYTHFFKKYSLDPKTCVFFDDKIENIQAAQKLGMHGVHVGKQKKLFSSTPNIKKMKEEFEKLISNHNDTY